MKYFKWFCMVGLLLAVACEKEDLGRTRSITFNATIEQFRDPSDGQKIVLRNEQWIYWEVGDSISIGSERSTLSTRGDLVNATPGTDYEDFNGVFIAELPENSTKFLGLHPCNSGNVIKGKADAPYFETPVLQLAATQPLRHDSTFSRSILPMVAWYGGNWDENDPTPFNLDFHNLGAIVRIQLFNATGADATIDHITFTSVADPTKGIVAKNLSGPFSVHNYTTENPHLGELDGGSKTVTITCGEDGLAFAQNALKSFYLVLPAFGGRETTTNLCITMDVVTKAGTHCIKTFTAPTRRTGVTYMNAMGVSAWSETGAASAGLVGNGTVTRPFKVYTINDLLYLRSCYNASPDGSGYRRINGQPITANTYIKIMRSDIVLTRSNWTTGIRNFVGHLTSMSNSANPGIVDSCVDVPLFESIGSDGEVEGLALKSAVTFTLTSGTGVSPFCYSNAGTIKNCVITTIPGASSKVNLAGSSSFAGICVINSGTIEGCRFGGKAEVQEGKNFAGICLQNTGTIKGCQISSPAAMTFASNGSTAAGICYENQAGGTVRDCYFAADITSSTINWAGIVYENSGTVEHCYFSSTGHIYTSKEVGGIVRTNKGASSKIDYCWLEGPLRGKIMGGIVDSLAAGTVINCFTQLNAMITIQNATDIGGGLVARMTGGSIENSYVNEFYLQVENANATFGGIVGKATGGSVTNCYDKENRNVFYGTTSGVTYNRCYLVDGSQTEVTSISSALAISATGTSGCLVDLLNDNTYGAPAISGAKGWTNSNGFFPVLAAYTIRSKWFGRY